MRDSKGWLDRVIRKSDHDNGFLHKCYNRRVPVEASSHACTQRWADPGSLDSVLVKLPLMCKSLK